ncbi:MAG: beta-propeller domain-containing protein, partial [Intrasporangiaceae bacterium]|nr:beta-propeller domain-containing protein [Intrasporangiaceae bacterium]
LLACEQVNRPVRFSGLGMLSVLTVDVDGGDLDPDPDDVVGVLAGGDTVYASVDALYVATTRWIDWDAISSDDVRQRRWSEVTTEIHRFDLEVAERADYAASGKVPGRLLSQWAMSEHDGVLRVASTSGDPWGGGADVSESYVTTLEQDGNELVQLGQVDGLGLTERIYAVRFIDDVGYVVTFRETDPLYTIDLADPRDPRMTGELKILGYSAYLHPIGDDRLLGIGQDADDRGRVKGTQLSLFDVSDPNDPIEIDKVVLTDASSDAEHDHRAFMHHPASGLTVVPFTRWSYDPTTGTEDVDTGAIGFGVRDGTIEQRGRITHLPAWLDDLRAELEGRDTAEFDDEDWRDQERLWQWRHRGRISRSLVLDDRLVTVSELGVGVHDLMSLDDTGWLGFDQ